MASSLAAARAGPVPPAPGRCPRHRRVRRSRLAGRIVDRGQRVAERLAKKATTSTVSGGAFGYLTDLSLFGGPATVRGFGQKKPPGNAKSASPSVKLPKGGSATAVTATDSDGALAQYGPAVVFSGRPPADASAAMPPSGALTVSTKGTRTVTSSASVKNVGAGPFTASSVRSTCKASPSGTQGSVTIVKGELVTAADADGNPTATETIPSHPDVNFTLTGVNDIGDQFKAVFNEQTVGADGTITVTGVHLYLQGPTAVGDVVIARCHARA